MRVRTLVVLAFAAALLVGLAAPASALPTGVDVASHQHPGGAGINWNQVRAAGHTYAFVKATEGTNYTNPWFASDFAGAGNAGLYRGAYHYARPALPLTSATDQARYFVSRAGSMTGPADLPAVLDLEETGSLGPADLAEWTRRWLGEVERLTGKTPMLYTGYYFWRDNVGNPTDIGSRYRLWLPSYPSDPDSTTFRPLVPAGWGTWTFWQYTSTGAVPGISGNVDVNRFCCDGPSLTALAGGGGGAGSPFGSLDVAVGQTGQVVVGGWAIDPDSTGPIAVHVYVGADLSGIVAAGSRPDVGATFTGFGDGHGFSAALTAAPGPQQVCAYGINTGGGQHRLLGCRGVNVLPHSPIGALDVVRPVIGGIDVAGWAIDPDTPASIPVHLYVDDALHVLPASNPRPDVAGVYTGLGSAHGYSGRVQASPGRHQVCAYGINTVGPGGNDQLGCRTVVVPGGSAFGSLDLATTAGGSIRVAGWTLDPDTPGPTPVHVYVNGVVHGALADRSRPDVAAAFPGASAARGFDLTVARVGSGPNTVCAYAIDTAGSGSSQPIACRVL